MIDIPCVRCGYCCKKATCDIGLTHGAKPTNCMFLIGDLPGNYSCFLAEKEPYQDIKMHLNIGAGCCSPLNTDRKIALKNGATSSIPPPTEVAGILEDDL